MNLSEHARQALEREERRFTTQLTAILEAEATRRATEMLRGMLDGLAEEGRWSPTAPSQAVGTKARRRTGRRAPGAVEELVEVLRAAGGTAKPGDVSKALNLTPRRRRHLVATAMAEGRVRTTGEKWSTLPILAE